MPRVHRSFPGGCLFLILIAFSQLGAQWNLPNPVISSQQQADRMVFQLQRGSLEIQICSDAILRVRYSPTTTFKEANDYVVVKQQWPGAQWTTRSTDKEVIVATRLFQAAVNKEDGSILYSNLAGARLIQETSRTLTPVKVNGEDTYRAESFFPIYGSTEGLYGLGQHQTGVWNYRGSSVDLSQENTEIAVPLLVSTNGYGIFWNNTSRTRFNNRFVMSLYVSSEVADVIDYYFLYGPEFDSIVRSYRELTGQAPMFGRWAYGFWQCKNKYQSQQELLGVAHKYREMHIPVDNIVQDWFWWNHKGEHVFNSKYPDPKGMIDDLHRNNFHLMISVWPFFDKGTAVYEEMDKLGYFIDRTKVQSFHPPNMALYDATNPAARAYYWSLMDKALFKLGADAWWLDTTEPETEGREENIMLHNKVSIGSGARYANLFPLMTVQGVYEGQRKSSDNKRVFILSRSAFAGSQRYSVTAWSGDILSTFESYKRQVPAGLNHSISGIPYWTTDIGGFFIGNPDDPGYRELFVRWFQYGTFCPIFRVHGTRTTDQNELWSYGPDAQKVLVSFDRLRYRLMPYIYSLAWKTTNDAYTPMRPLVMDFREDVRAQNIGDQFLFGPAILVNPVTEPAATSRRVYLPKARWFDFWTGDTVAGGQTIDAAAPLERLPLYVRAGSILPLGPDMEFASAKPADPIELRVYQGANGSFTLYEDENDGYGYERGAYATIPMEWDESSHSLRIGDRKGSFPGMLEARTFRVVFVHSGRGSGIDPAGSPDKVVQYAGKAITVRP